MEMNEWLQKTYDIMQIKISQEELEAVNNLYLMIMVGMSEANKLGLADMDPALTYTLKGNDNNDLS